jgi:hypothetical protein
VEMLCPANQERPCRDERAGTTHRPSRRRWRLPSPRPALLIDAAKCFSDNRGHRSRPGEAISRRATCSVPVRIASSEAVATSRLVDIRITRAIVSNTAEPLRMFANALFFALTLRCGLDIFLPGEKGNGAVALYVIIALGLMVIRIAMSGLAIHDAFVCLGIVLFLAINLLWIPGEATPQVYFSSTILLPIIFLLVLSRCEPAVFTRLQNFS